MVPALIAAVPCKQPSRDLQCTCICRYLDLLESVSPESAVTAKAQIVYENKKLEDMVLPTMVSSSELDDIVQPKSR